MRKGQYGASAVFDEVEFKLDESKVRLNPNAIELTDEQSMTESDLTYRIQSGQVYLKIDAYIMHPSLQNITKILTLRQQVPLIL